MHKKNQNNIKKKKAEGSIGTAIKVLTAVVLGAAILVGLYGLTTGVVLSSTETAVNSMFAYAPEESSGNGGTVEPTPDTEPTILDGANQVVLMSVRTDVRVRSSAPLSEFQEVQVNGETLSEDDYYLTEGSTIVTLTESYLSQIGEGTHEISVVSDCGAATTNFTLVNDNKIPEGHKYYQASSAQQCGWCMAGTNISCPSGKCECGFEFDITPTPYAGENFPEPKNGDMYIVGDYIYKFEKTNSTTFWWSVKCLDMTKSSYGEMLSIINGVAVSEVDQTFWANTNLEIAPLLPSTITKANNVFAACSSLRTYVGNPDGDYDFSNYPIPEGIRANYISGNGQILFGGDVTSPDNMSNVNVPKQIAKFPLISLFYN